MIKSLFDKKPVPPTPKYIEAHVLKVRSYKAPEAEHLRAGYVHDIRFIPFPGMNCGSYIGLVRYVVPEKIVTALGFQIVKPGKMDTDFYYFNLLGEEKLEKYSGQEVIILFTCTIPQTDATPLKNIQELSLEDRSAQLESYRPYLPDWPSWQVNFAGADGLVQTAGLFSKRTGSWLFDVNVAWNFNPVPLAAKTDDIYYVFAGGAPKSGTTWVEKILNSSADVMSTGEGNFFIYNEDVIVEPHNFWYPAHTSGYDAGLLGQAGRADLIFRAINKVWPHRIFMDRAPSYGYCYAKPLAAFPDAKIIHCRRHPLDVAVSRVFHEINILRGTGAPTPGIAQSDVEHTIAMLEKPEGMQKGDLFAESWGYLRRILDEWVFAERSFELAMRDFPNRGIAVVYEHLLSDFKDETKRLMDFMGLPVTDEELEAMQEKTAFKTLSEGRKQGEEDTSSFFRKGVAGDYLNYFTDEQIEAALTYVNIRKGSWQNKPWVEASAEEADRKIA